MRALANIRWWRESWSHPATRVWLCLPFLAIIAAAFGLVVPSPPASDAWLPYELTLQASTAESGRATWWWNRHAGFVTHGDASAPVRATSQLETVHLRMPAGRIVRGLLQFSAAEFRLSADVGVSLRGESVTSWSLHSARVVRDSATITAEGNMLLVRRNPTAADCQLELTFQPAMVLPVPRTDLPATIHATMTRQRLIAAAMLVIGVILPFVVSRRPVAGPRIAPNRWLQAGVLIHVACAILFARRPDVFALPQFWAEDGAVFFSEQQQLGPAAIFRPYAGYVHLWPRITAALAGALPVVWAPVLYLASTLLALAIAVLRVASSRVLLPLPAICAVAIVLVPNMDELVLNVTNAQWFGAIALLGVAASRSGSSRAPQIADVAIIIVFGLTGPFAILLLPLFLVRVACNRTRESATLLAIALGVAAIQLGCYIRTSEPAVSSPFHGDALQLLAAAGWRTGGELTALTSLLDCRALPGVGVGLLLVWISCAALTLRAVPFRIHAMLGLAAVAVLAGGLVRFRGYPDELFLTSLTERYFHLPILVTAWLLIAGACRLTGWRRWVSRVMAGVLVLHGIFAFRIPPLVDFDWLSHARAISAGTASIVPINPAPWAIVQSGTSIPRASNARE